MDKKAARVVVLVCVRAGRDFRSTKRWTKVKSLDNFCFPDGHAFILFVLAYSNWILYAAHAQWTNRVLGKSRLQAGEITADSLQVA
jgi:hypothetical protein